MDTIMVDSTSKQNDSWILTEKPRPNKTKRLFSTNARCLGIFGLLVHVCMYTCMFMYVHMHVRMYACMNEKISIILMICLYKKTYMVLFASYIKFGIAFLTK